MTARLLVLSTYPAIRPRHGGQKRTLAICNAYRRAGYQVVQSAIFNQAFYPAWSTTDIPVPVEIERKIAASPLTGDVIVGQVMTEDPVVRNALERLLFDFRPDVIHVEQPFLYPGLRRHLTTLGQTPLLVYGSQNIEAPMKEVMLRSYGWAPDRVASYTQDIHQMELVFSRESDLVAACTPADLHHHRRFGARRVVLAPNGVDAPVGPGSGFEDLDVAPKLAGKRIALYVGSAHPPNLVGYQQLVGADLSFLPSDVEIVVVGGISTSIRRYLKTLPKEEKKGRPVLAGMVTETQLRDLIQRSEVILLPLTTGGGSNLKSAEAVAADKKVVASSHALRSFEWFREFPNVWVADAQAEFKAAVHAAFAADFVERSPVQREAASVVYWDNCLGDLVTAVDALVAQRRSSAVGAD